MKTTFIFIFLLLTLSSYTQNTMTIRELKAKTDSILMEGNLLYKYERCAWVSTDLVRGKETIKNNFGGYLIYQIEDTIKAIILDQENTNCIYELSFTDNFNIPIAENLTKRRLTVKEEVLINIRTKIIDKIIEEKYEIIYPDNFNLNFQLIPCPAGYKLYVLTGTTLTQIIPFGNDYVFFADKNGNITSWRQLHSVLLDTNTAMENGEKITNITHTHSASEPLITATDICTFMLYGSLYGLKEFSVYSPSLSKYFKYSLIYNEIDILDQLY